MTGNGGLNTKPRRRPRRAHGRALGRPSVGTSNVPLVVGRSTNGLVKTATVSSTTEMYSYNVNGECTAGTTSGITGGCSVVYGRDTIGRVTKKTETIGGSAVVDVGLPFT